VRPPFSCPSSPLSGQLLLHSRFSPSLPESPLESWSPFVGSFFSPGPRRRGPKTLLEKGKVEKTPPDWQEERGKLDYRLKGEDVLLRESICQYENKFIIEGRGVFFSFWGGFFFFGGVFFFFLGWGGFFFFSSFFFLWCVFFSSFGGFYFLPLFFFFFFFFFFFLFFKESILQSRNSHTFVGERYFPPPFSAS